MVEHPNQPKIDDVILGGQSKEPVTASVLGGLSGVKLRLASSSDPVRIAAIKEALQYGQQGTDLVLQIIKAETGAVQQAAWNLLFAFGTQRTQQELFKHLQVFTYHAVTLNREGIEIKKHQGLAQFFPEDLGNGISLEMVAIPGNTFLMGAAKTEAKRSDNESPQHLVRVKPFFIGKYPVTQAQWQAVADFPAIKQSLDPNPSCFSGANRPVEGVSWYDAVEFCTRLSRKTGRDYRLPSEAEWEYACRAGTTTPFHCGKTITTEIANYCGNVYSRGPQGIYRAQTTPVGSFGANAFGLSDMHGNVWEWCADPWHLSYAGAPADGRVWQDSPANDRQLRLRRGGAYDSNPESCRSAFRDLFTPGVRYNVNGFRVVCTSMNYVINTLTPLSH